MEQSAIKKDYQTVDLLKFLFCICIVSIHASFVPGQIFLRAIFRLGVPFFFVTSGFFLGKKLIADENDVWPTIKKYCLRLLKPFLVFSTITIIENLITGLLKGQPFLEAVGIQVWYLLVYPRGALWYLSACMVGALLLIPFLRAKKLNLALLIGTVLYGFALLCNNYYFLINDTQFEYYVQKYLNYFDSARNGVFVGFLFLAIGIKCAQLFFGREEKLKKSLIYPFFAVTLFLYFVEAYLVERLTQGVFREDCGYFVLQIIAVPLLLFMALKTELPIPNRFSRLLRDCSVGIYLLHKPLLWILGWFSLPNYANYAIVLAFALTICLVTYYSQKEPFYSLLR